MIQTILLLYLINATVGIPMWIWVIIIAYIALGLTLSIIKAIVDTKIQDC